MPVKDDVQKMLDTATSEVINRFDSAQQYADSAFNSLQTFLGQLGSALGGLSPAAIRTTVHEFEPVEVNVENNSDFDPSDDMAKIDAILDDVSGLDKPTKPTLTIPDLSSFADLGPVVRARDDAMNRLNEIVTLFRGIQADLNSIDFSDTYASDLLTALKDRVEQLIVDGGASFDDEIATRELQRDIQARQDAIADFLSQTAGNGFELPSGFALAGVAQIESEWQNKRLEILQAFAQKELEIRHATMNESMKAGIEIEKALMDYSAKIKGLIVEAKKAVIELAVALINGYDRILEAYIKVYQAQVQAFEASVRGELAKAQLYEAESRIFSTTIDAYIKQIGAYREKIMAEVEILKADAAIAQLEGDFKLKVLEFSEKHTLASEEAALKAHEIAIQDGTRRAGLAIEAARGAVAALSQLVASALTSIHVAAHIAGNASASESYSFNESVSTDTNYNFS